MMKIIVSHDVDHITAAEHWRDLQIPKSIVRSSIELVKGKISVAEYALRFMEIGANKLHNLDDLMGFDREHGVDSTFFLGVNHGLGLCYSLQNAASWAKKIAEKGFEVGVHGIEFDDAQEIKREHELFSQISGLDEFGIRMHYLRTSKDTLRYLDRAGYGFDSSVYQLDNPFKVGNLWEFPLHIMDTYVFNHDCPWQNRTPQQAFEATVQIIENCHEKGIHYLTLLLHDRYFSDAFESWKQWYVRVINYLRDNEFKFVNYHRAIDELESLS
jgi:peptidoglycan/xylan/chitin deacetylase (PgdA/CDA1 family)